MESSLLHTLLSEDRLRGVKISGPVHPQCSGLLHDSLARNATSLAAQWPVATLPHSRFLLAQWRNQFPLVKPFPGEYVRELVLDNEAGSPSQGCEPIIAGLVCGLRTVVLFDLP
jgi:hypothetical protein